MNDTLFSGRDLTSFTHACGRITIGGLVGRTNGESGYFMEVLAPMLNLVSDSSV